jgi:hypothetical protein
MRRLTLRLPETLFHRLELLADSEGVSLNQYLVYSLTQSVARAYRAIPVAEDEIERQHAQLNKMITSLDVASDGEFDAILAEGESDEKGTGLDPELVARIEAKIAKARQPTTG